MRAYFRLTPFAFGFTPLLIALWFSFNKLIGSGTDEGNGIGPGSYDVRGNVWYLNCCGPDNKLSEQGWSIFNAFFGWTNNGSGVYQLLVSFVCDAPPIGILIHSWKRVGVRILLDCCGRCVGIFEVQGCEFFIDAFSCP
jgi:hypothetical protein